MPPSSWTPSSRRRTAVAVLAVTLAGAACAPTDEPAEVPFQEADEPDTALPGDTGPDPAIAPDPDVALPAGFALVIIPDAQTGPFQLGAPEEAVVWAVGTSLGSLERVTAGTEWWAFWEPRLATLDPETSNVRAMIAIPEGDEIRSLQVNVDAYDLDVDPQDAREIAESLALVAEAQGSEVISISTVDYGGPQVDEVGQIVFSVDPELLARDVWQRFVPEPEENALWSVQCDGPTGIDLESLCTEALDAFRPPVT